LLLRPGPGDIDVPIALFALTLSTFAICSAEWGIAGLLPSLSSDLHISIPTAGLLVSFYALGVAVGGPILAILTARFPNKLILLVFMGVFVVGNVLCALAPNYQLLVVARVIVACGHGLFFGIATVVATNLLPTRQGFAVSMLFTGFTLAQLFGVPAGTAIGNAFGWRATFWTVSAAGALATVSLALLLPRSERRVGEARSTGDGIRALNHQQVYLTYLAIALLVTGGLSLSTYLVPLMTEITHIPLAQTPWYLLILGAGGLVGNLIGGRLADWKLMPTLIVIFFGQGILQLCLILTSTSATLLAINFFVMSVMATSFGAHVTKRVLNAARDAPNLASTLSSTAFNIGIAAGAWVGGMALSSGFSYAQLPWLPFVFNSAAGCVIVASMLLDRRAAMPVSEPV
jgi:DHA1 family inner membrane transport protein